MSKRKPKLEIYKARDGWRWRLRASNGRILACSGEALKARSTDAWITYSLALEAALYDSYVDVVRK